ncbi:MAG: hypothetical protein KUG67_02840 [Proteobacteria bacterium]|nr:hypothetical protein [Pseudomonadota bacterium]
MRCVVRVRTCRWSNGRGLCLKKSVTVLKRKSSGYNLLEEDINNLGAEEVMACITNLNEVDDGLYLFSLTNISSDWETGQVDDYDYVLVPYYEED